MENIIKRFNEGNVSIYDVVQFAENAKNITMDYKAKPENLRDQTIDDVNFSAKDLASSIREAMDHDSRSTIAQTQETYQTPGLYFDPNDQRDVYATKQDIEYNGNGVHLVDLDDKER